MNRAAPIQRMKLFSRGESLTAARLNQIISAINRSFVGNLPPSQLLTPGQPTPCRQFLFVSDGGDYLIVNDPADTSQTPTAYYVAKPYLLRQTPFDGTAAGWNGNTYTYTNGYTRTATNGANTESQVIVPSYVAKDIIFACIPSGGTGVTIPAGSTVNSVVTNSPIIVSLQDLNCDGRAWAATNATAGLSQQQVLALGGDGA